MSHSIAVPHDARPAFGRRLLTVLAIASLAACGAEETGASSSLAGNTGTGDQDAAVDSGAGTNDAAGTDAGSAAKADVPTGAADKPRGFVYARDPVSDKGQVTEVTMTKPITKDGTLKSNWVEIRNCLNEDGGEPIKYMGLTAGHFCVEKRTAKPGKDGHYLHIKPPAKTSDGNDKFAEVQMYNHVNAIHDYFKNTHGLTDVDFPLHALINVQVKLTGLAAAALGQKPGWSGMPNAAFMPPEAFKQLPLPPRDTGAIVFFQWNDVDFSYDASVIYHEYTHAMVGTTRLQGSGLGLFGMDNWRGSMNEGFADYFAASMSDYAVVGAYALAVVGPHLKRDLTEKRTCPADITTEIHADGRIVGAALWAVRKKLGKVTADSIVLNALQSFTKQTTLDGAMKLIVAEAKKQGKKAEVEAILKDHGVIDCIPAKPWQDWYAQQSKDLLPITVEGKQNGVPLADGMPGYLQFYVDVPAGTEGVELSFEASGGGGGFGGFGGGGGGPQLGLAVRKKDPVTVSVFSGSVLADHKFAVAANPGKASMQTITLGAGCLPKTSGRIYTLMLNKGGRAQVKWMGIKLLKKGDKAINPAKCN